MEGLDLDEEEVAEIVTDLRMNRQDSLYCKESYALFSLSKNKNGKSSYQDLPFL